MDELSGLNIVDSLSSHNKNKEKKGIMENGNVKNQYPSVFVSTLTLTEDHPLMSLSSPDSPPGNCSHPISFVNHEKIKCVANSSFNKDLSIRVYGQDECVNSNVHSGEFCSLFNESFSPDVGPHRNTSKNNLYISDSVVSPESSKSVYSDDTINSSNNIDDSICYVKPMSLPKSAEPNAFVTDMCVSCCHQLENDSSICDKSKDDECADGYDEQGCITLNTQTSIPANGFCTFKKEENDSVKMIGQDTHCYGLRRSSWSHSDSSINSLCHSNHLLLEEDGCDNQHIDIESDECTERIESNKIPEYSFNDEMNECRKWLKVTLPSGERKSLDMKVIEPYKRVLSHGGYALSGRRDAIVVFSACFLPDTCRVDYNYVMDNLFLYVLTTMDQLVTDDYILVYLHGSASKRSMPTFHWLKKCYQLIDRRLRKSLKHLYLVHPTFWLKSVMFMTRPFISSKFFNKLTYVYSLEELSKLVPVEYAAIPEKVKRFDSLRS